MDFLNTTFSPHGVPIELIGDGRSFVGWLVSAGLLEPSAASKLQRRFGTRDLDTAAEEARKVRTWAGEWLSRWRDIPHDNYDADLRYLNALLARTKRHREVEQISEGLQLTERCSIDAADELIALVAEQIALLITTAPASRVKRCAGAACTLWFMDRTKAGRRLFCSAEVCGNRAKVAAFRKRQRTT
jgi:hypothetical protein